MGSAAPSAAGIGGLRSSDAMRIPCTSLLPPCLSKDDFGNFFCSIGCGSTTLFTCHLDTASTEMLPVTHVFEGNIVKTDGSTLLGGDDKTGVAIMCYMMARGVSGAFWFFIGEEVGCAGSQAALNSRRDFFKQFRRVVAFDRRGYNSVITRQSGQDCCSAEFAEALSREMSREGLEYRPDNTGLWTDSATFMQLESPPEITNLSTGCFDCHHTSEYVDLAFLEKVARVAAEVKWEDLPSKGVAARPTVSEDVEWPS